MRSTLEAEVGAIMGGPAFKKVRDRIEEQFARFWSPTGQRRGRQNDARVRVEAAERAAHEAGERLRELEQGFVDLESARLRLNVLQRELSDDTDAQTRRDLVASLEVASAAALIVATRKAEHEAIGTKLRGLEDLSHRHQLAFAMRREAQLALEQAKSRRGDLSDGLARIGAITPADEGVGLARGAEALRLFVAGVAQEEEIDETDLPDIDTLTAAVARAGDATAGA